ncbi:MAG: hypothetical protein KDC49_15445 [Saprospiraceae bacterium]|nr:hypothetical protein [Saprospiraceae bacterium]
MRIIAEAEKEGFKITVFKYEEKVSIKFERDQMEYLHKFRQGAVICDATSALNYVNHLFENGFMESHIKSIEQQMKSLRLLISTQEDQFPKII